MAAHGDIGNESIEILLRLQQRWHAALAERVERYVEVAAPGDDQEAVRAAFRDTARAHLALRLVLDEFAYHPALALPRRWEHIMLADAAGVRGPYSRNRDAAAAGAMLVADLHPVVPDSQVEHKVSRG
jgi:hypothetical protein